MPTISAPPNLWDFTQAAIDNRLKDVDPLRGHYLTNDYYALADQSRDPGLQAQLGALGQYQAQALGQAGPSAAEQQMAEQGRRQAAQAIAMGARGRGGGIAGMQQQAMAAQTYGGQQLRAQQEQLRNAEQTQSQAAAAQLGGQLYQQGFGYDQLQNAGTIASAQNTLDWYKTMRGMDMERDQASKAYAMGLIQSGAGAVGGVMGAISKFSDERVKTGIRDGGLSATEAVGEVQPKTYQYKPGYGPPGERVGPMAQDLEKTPAGAALVSNTPYGKTVDVGGLAALSVAAASEQQHKIEELQAQVQRLSGMLGSPGGAARQGLGM